MEHTKKRRHVCHVGEQDVDLVSIAKRQCRTEMDAARPNWIDPYTFVQVLTLVQPLIHFEEVQLLKLAFGNKNRILITNTLMRTCHSLYVRPCRRITREPKLNYGTHVCDCKTGVRDLLNPKEYPALRVLVALRTHRHPVLSTDMRELQGFSQLTKLYLCPTRASANTNWWLSLPQTLVDLSIFFDVVLPTKLDHMLNVANLNLGCEIATYTDPKKTARHQMPFQYLPPNLTALKIHQDIRGEVNGALVRHFPRGITWLEVAALSDCMLQDLPPALVHLKTAGKCDIAQKSVLETDYSLSADELVAKYSPRNWTSLSSPDFGAFYIRALIMRQHSMSITNACPSAITDLDLGCYRYNFVEPPCPQNVPHGKMETVRILRSSMPLAEPNVKQLSKHVPNLEYASVNLQSMPHLEPELLSPLKNLAKLQSLHIHYSNFVTDCSELGKSFPDTLTNLVISSDHNPKIELYLPTNLLRLKLAGPYLFLSNVKLKTGSVLQLISVTLLYGPDVPNKLQDQIDTIRNNIASQVVHAPPTDIYVDSARSKHNGTRYRDMAESFCNLVDYTSMWGWRMNL